MGDFLRHLLKQDNETSKKLRNYADNGEIIPDELITNLVKEEIIQFDRLILHNFPRTINTFELMKFEDKDSLWQIKQCLYIKTDIQILDRLFVHFNLEDLEMARNRLILWRNRLNEFISFLKNKLDSRFIEIEDVDLTEEQKKRFRNED